MVSPMDLGRLHADAQAQGGLLDGPTGGQELEHLPEPRWETLQVRRAPLGEAEHESARGGVGLVATETRLRLDQVGQIERQASDPLPALGPGASSLLPDSQRPPSALPQLCDDPVGPGETGELSSSDLEARPPGQLLQRSHGVRGDGDPVLPRRGREHGHLWLLR